MACASGSPHIMLPRVRYARHLREGLGPAGLIAHRTDAATFCLSLAGPIVHGTHAAALGLGPAGLIAHRTDAATFCLSLAGPIVHGTHAAALGLGPAGLVAHRSHATAL